MMQDRLLDEWVAEVVKRLETLEERMLTIEEAVKQRVIVVAGDGGLMAECVGRRMTQQEAGMVTSVHDVSQTPLGGLG